MSIIPFRKNIEDKNSEKNPIKSFCLISNENSYGSMFIENEVITFVMINLAVSINENSNQRSVIGGLMNDPKFPMIYNEGDPIPFLLGDNKILRIEVYNFNEEHIGALTMIQNENDPRHRINIFIQRVPPYDLDGFMWGIDHIYINCKDCPVENCPSRGELPWKEKEM